MNCGSGRVCRNRWTGFLTAPRKSGALTMGCVCRSVFCSITCGACITSALFFRTADGAGIERLLLSGITARPPKSAISKTALGAEERVPWDSVADLSSGLRELREHGYEIAAIETSNRAVDLFDWRPHFPVCVLFGHEVEGISADILAACDTHVRIPMLGLKHSLNVASAGSIVMYELLRKYRQLRGLT